MSSTSTGLLSVTSFPEPRLQFYYPPSDNIDTDLLIIDNDIKHGLTPTQHRTLDSTSRLHASNMATQASNPGAGIGSNTMYANAGGSGGGSSGTYPHPLCYILPRFWF